MERRKIDFKIRYTLTQISGLVWLIPQLLRATQPQNPREVIKKKIVPYAYGKFWQESIEKFMGQDLLD
jgi:hypothetical protein